MFALLKNFPKKHRTSAHQYSTTDWFNRLRQKWKEVPGAGNSRVMTNQLLDLSDDELVSLWSEIVHQDTTGERFTVRGWYHLLYKDIFRDKRIMDFGSGLGIDGITFAQHGAKVTFVDIVESNLAVLKRLCKLLDVTDANFCYMEDVTSLSVLPKDFDVIWCQGSLINAPIEIIRAEAQELLKHLGVGGRWIELAYPKTRWERDKRPPFERWGEVTDGVGTPWVEWYDLPKLQAVLEPAQFDVVMYFDFHNDDFNWFDLIRRS